MSNPYAAAHPYNEGTTYERCPKCAKCNEVQVTKQDGHNESEEYCCAGCGKKLGTARASTSPRTTIVDDSKCNPPESSQKK